jgi:hypothetical protein
MSSADRRVKRPKLARTSARRSVAALFGAPTLATWSLPPGGPPGDDGTHGEPWSDVIARSVDLGYRVIDDYVRQGERVARAVGERGPMAGPAAAFGDPQDAARRMAQYATEMATLWFQMLQGSSSAAGWFMPPPFPGFAAAAADPSARAAAGDGVAPRAPAASRPSNGDRPVRVVVQVRSAQAAEVAIDLRPEASGKRVAVQALRSPTPGPPRISDVALSGDGVDAPLTLRIAVPDDQPAGIYNGMVIDEDSGLPLGTVSLLVGQG